MKQCLLFFLKYPEAGRVKSRLAAEVGEVPAAELAKAMAEDLLDSLKWLEDVDLIVCFDPKERAGDMAEWLGPERTYWPQRGQNLGLRMKNAFSAAFRKGYDRAVLMGGDVPCADDNAVRPVFERLEGDAAAIGPSEDGGYWLIGFSERGFAPEAFTDVDWGTDKVLAQTLKWLEFSQKQIVLAPLMRDVDTLGDLRALVEAGRLGRHSRTLAQARKLLAAADQ
ncbi:TIGR04282 family arsenosugar biosynthesis glycosyltransferase [Paucidesulfovibrio longus]|uniref:TIGR04282 family arsenosugar biosynthesis glycosyltransferase n=1 Tax=Paucidesulfovibrio longus TaxID=889 RepID=UPI0003B54C66|nr:TIGR04282 family arsenosugar biosynthesis glycosyltransferase [Paucidesulfovibrio longus]